MKNIIISENQLKFIIKEMAYPQTFNMDEFKSIRSFKDRIEYCKQRLRRLGAGTSRIVFEIDNEKVLKLAKNSKGIGQNQEEIRMGNDMYASNCFAEVYDYDNTGTFLEMERARPAKESDFERLVGFPFDMYCDFITRCALNYLGNRNKNPWIRVNHAYDDAYNNLIDEWDSDLFIYNVFEYMQNFQLITWGDLTRISSYGVVNRNGQEEMVIIDFGFTEDVYNNYYRKK